MIVGASVAGVAAARALRAEGYQRDLVLIGDEPDWPYDRPPLSKQVLSGQWDAAQTTLLTPNDAKELSIDVHLGVPAGALQLERKEVVLSNGSRVPYSACVIATGSSPRPSPWPEPSGVHVLRTLRDALAIRDRFLSAESVAIVGGGFIGAEVASSARALGLTVTIIDPLRLPMERVAGSTGAGLFTDLATRNGIELRLGRGVVAIDGAQGDLTLRLSDGTTVEVDTAVVGIGAVPNDRWLAASGVVVRDGIVCDEFCRAVGTQDVYAAGDVARWHHPHESAEVRVEHWTNAVEQAACVARNLVHADDPRPYAPVPYVWTGQHGCMFQIIGHPETARRHDIVGDLSAENPRAALIYGYPDGRLAGALTVNWPRALAACRRGIVDRTDSMSVVEALRFS